MKDLHKWKHLFCKNATPINRLEDFHEVKISVKRDDLNHHVVQGNKLRKLKYNIHDAIDKNYSCIATFGGAWSNHIVATAQATKLCGLKSMGFIRGDELYNKPHLWSNTLKQANELGMKLVFLSRVEYRLKRLAKQVILAIENCKNDLYFIPEGGSNKLAILGVAEIISELQIQNTQPTHIIAAVGTGGTLAGLIEGVTKAQWKTKVIGIPVLKNATNLQSDIEYLVSDDNQVNWKLYNSYHFGGYAKTTHKLHQFGADFKKTTGIDLDKIYTSKSFYAAYDLIAKGEIPCNSRVLIVHTGGMQGGSIVESI